MKKVLLSILILGMTFSVMGCSNSKELEDQIVALQSENQKLSDENANLNKELQVFKEKEEEQNKEKIRIEEEKSKYKEVKINELVVIDGYGEFTIKSAELKQKVIPPNPATLYTYYEVKDPNEIYLDVVMEFKNTTTIGIGADEITSVNVIYGDGYEYSSFSTLEESGGTNFTYTNINKVEPLKSIKLHHLATLPIESKDSEKPIKIQFAVYGSNYELAIR